MRYGISLGSELRDVLYNQRIDRQHEKFFFFRFILSLGMTGWVG